MSRFILLLLAISVIFPSSVQAQSASTDNTARVGNHFLSLSGYIAPFASVVVTTDSTFLASSVADEKGNFVFSNILVNTGLDSLCLEAVDAKNIGSSFTCFEIDPVRANRKISGIFLPPTLGLSGTVLRPGSSVIASGYSMPGARVILNIGDGIIIDTFADQDGYWSIELSDLPVGKYKLFATANYQSQESLIPDRKKDLEVVSLINIIKDNSRAILAILILIILSIILALLLRSRRFRNKIRRLLGRKPVPVSSKKGLHHEWFIGF